MRGSPVCGWALRAKWRLKIRQTPRDAGRALHVFVHVSTAHDIQSIESKDVLVMKRTYHPSKTRRARTHGFLVRMKTRGGRAVINARRAKGRKRLAV